MFEINHNDNTKVLLTDEFLIFFEKFGCLKNADIIELLELP